MPKDGERFDTKEIHAGAERDEHGSLTTPIDATSTDEYETPTDTGGDHRYSRTSEPTRDDLEAVFADLECGTDAAAFAGGTAAIDAAFE